MQKERYCYLIRVQYLGFRYSGWQKQPDRKTLEQMILKTLRYVLPGRKVKILAAGRTDAKVSALEAAFELFLTDGPLEQHELFLQEFNTNLPPDIRALELSEVSSEFNIIQHSKVKEYIYLFSFGEKNHPFCAPFLANIIEPLDLEAMKEAARLFEGVHDFSAYTVRSQGNSRFVRKVDHCVILQNTILSANFFPEKSYILQIRSAGFMRYQVRMIMGALIEVGKGKLSQAKIRQSLKEPKSIRMTAVAPGSGLVLNALEFE